MSIKDWGCGRGLAPLTVERGGFACQHEPLADLVDGVGVQLKQIGNLRPCQRPSPTIVIAEQQQLRMPDFLSRGMPMASDVEKTLALLIREHDGILMGRGSRSR